MRAVSEPLVHALALRRQWHGTALLESIVIAVVVVDVVVATAAVFVAANGRRGGDVVVYDDYCTGLWLWLSLCCC